MDNSYKKLDTYIKAKELVGKVYEFTKTFPDEEKYALSSQIRRAAISVPSNIAEGLSRSTTKRTVPLSRYCIWLFNGSKLSIRNSM